MTIIMTAADAADGGAGVAAGTELIHVGGLLVLGVALLWLILVIRRELLVSGASTALRQLDELNELYEPLVRRKPRLRVGFRESVNSKGKFDRFDLTSFMTRSILEREHWLEPEIVSRRATVDQHRAYEWEFERLGSGLLGTSSHERLRRERFNRTEKRVFNRRKLKRPTPTARVRGIVTYTSPQGRNSYSRRLEWNFDQLRLGLQRAQEQRAHQSTAQFLRQREREKMTAGLRMQILRRDDFRCRMCGASRQDGAQLHVDHIRPVSRGGRTAQENLQVLCAPCNLGKSNHFVG